MRSILKFCSYIWKSLLCSLCTFLLYDRLGLLTQSYSSLPGSGVCGTVLNSRGTEKSYCNFVVHSVAASSLVSVGRLLLFVTANSMNHYINSRLSLALKRLPVLFFLPVPFSSLSD
jgi:hypothetical protein